MSHESPVVVCARQLVKTYGGQTVVDHIDLTVHRGQCVGLLGPNGAGKSTTLKMIMGQTPPSHGRIAVMDYDVPAQTRQMHTHLGVVPQADNLDPDFTVEENLRTFAGYFALPGGDVETRIQRLLQFAELTDKTGASIKSLSGGMQRRLSLIRALINDPALLILDEPTTGLDPQARQHMWQRLRMLLKQGKTMLLTTHYMEEAERLCDVIMIIHGGKIIAQGSPAQLIRQYVNSYVIEIYAPDGRLDPDFKNHKKILRWEEVGDTVFWYTNEPDQLLQALKDKSTDWHYHYRPANLEDVFLRLTGRDLLEN